MAQLVISNIIFSARVSPKAYTSKDMPSAEAFKAMVDKVDTLRQKQGWEIYDIFDNGTAKGFRLKITAKDDCEYYTEVYVRR